jgi:NADH oxidase (H2O2-forming)
MPSTIVVIGGSAAGMGAAGAAKQVDPTARVIVFTELQDVAYSPCGIPYVHGKEIDSFDRLILQGKEFYEAQGFEIHYETMVTSINLANHTVEVPGQGAVHFDRLVLGTGFEYERPNVPGGDLDGS